MQQILNFNFVRHENDGESACCEATKVPLKL